jgi:quercetin dioxygenase-like cupin family protein
MIERSPRPNWSPLPRPDTHGVEVRVHLFTEDVAIAELRFAPNTSIDEHPGERSAHVVCLSGEGFVSLGSESSPFKAGDRVLWPRGIPHRLWTEGSTMGTLMVESLRPPTGDDDD